MAPTHEGSTIGDLDGVTVDETVHRVLDVRFVLDQAQRLDAGLLGWSPLEGKLDMSRVGVAGHSFGAATALAAAGALIPRTADEASYANPRVLATIAMSPQAPSDARPYFPDGAFDSITGPVMNITGTHDEVGAVGLALRIAAFEQMPNGDKYLAVIHEANHGSFSRFGRLRDKRVSLALSTAFFHAYVAGLDTADDLLSPQFVQWLGMRYGGTSEHIAFQSK